eukprot:ANDGO_01498.mRNA.1 Retrovirus-related Pol polyprotein from transposon 412
MMDVLSGLVGSICEVFVDDICVYAQTPEEFISRLRAVLLRLREYGLRLKAEKCKLGLSEVVYLGHVVSGHGLRISPDKQNVIASMTSPSSRPLLRSFIGLVNYMRSFVRNFSSIIAPLHALCSERSPFIWDEKCQDAFENLKAAIASAPLLHHLDYSQEIVLRTDASTVGIGGMLLQRTPDGQERPVWFLSRKFTPTESKWSTIEQEAYAIFYCITELSHFLLGHRFVVETDHRNLVYLHQSQTPKLVRWRLRLQEYDFSIVHIAGESNCVSDALSRCLAVVDDPRVRMEAVHNAVIGHKGVRQTCQLLRDQGNTWPSMESDVAMFIASCATCQKVQVGKASFEAAQRTTSVDELFNTLAVDTIGPLPKDELGNAYLIVAIDAFSRFVELRASPDCTAKEVARLLLDIVGRYGPPKEVRSDNGSQYSAKIIDELLTLMGSRRNFTIPYRPQSNGIVERANAEVMRHLRSLVMDLRVHSRWSEVVPLVQRIINSSYHSAIGTCPIRIMFGDNVLPSRNILQKKEGGRASEITVVEEYIQHLVLDQDRLLESAKRYQAGVIQKRLADSKLDHTVPSVGDHVLVDFPNRPPSKLSPHWRGPLVVIAVSGSMISCQDLLDLRVQEFHVSRLKLFDSSRIDSPLQVAEADKDEWLVETIVDHRPLSLKSKSKKNYQFRVRWSGYGPEDDTWLGFSEVRDLKALDEYLTAHPSLRL